MTELTLKEKRTNSSIVIESFVKELQLFYPEKLAYIAYNLEQSGSENFEDWIKSSKAYRNIKYWMPLPKPSK